MAGALSVEEAQARILAGAAPSEAVLTVPLADAAGHVLAAPLPARLTQPPFDASAMDGYAVRAADLASLPARLNVIGEAAAGHGFTGTIGPGTAVRIFTGAPVPAGTDAIVIQENTRREGRHVTVIEGRPDPEHIRPRGGDFAKGALLLGPGRRLNSRDITLAAAMGYGELMVRRPPRVAILATGDELVPPGVNPGAHQIVCSNTYGIASLVRAAGGEPRLLGIAADTAESLASHVDQAGDADILVTVGGASVGDHDLVAPTLATRGMALDFWKITMRPGKPLMFGRLGAQRVLGLPGNPVSSLICSRLFLVPLIQALLGLPTGLGQPLQGRLAIPVAANGARTHYMRASSSVGADGVMVVTPVPNQDSSLMAPLAAADCLLVRPIGAPPLQAGATVPILTLDF